MILQNNWGSFFCLAELCCFCLFVAFIVFILISKKHLIQFPISITANYSALNDYLQSVNWNSVFQTCFDTKVAGPAFTQYLYLLMHLIFLFLISVLKLPNVKVILTVIILGT